MRYACILTLTVLLSPAYVSMRHTCTPTLTAGLTPRPCIHALCCVHMLCMYTYSYSLALALPMYTCALQVYFLLRLGPHLAHVCIRVLCIYTYSCGLAHTAPMYRSIPVLCMYTNSYGLAPASPTYIFALCICTHSLPWLTLATHTYYTTHVCLLLWRWMHIAYLPCMGVFWLGLLPHLHALAQPELSRFGPSTLGRGLPQSR